MKRAPIVITGTALGVGSVLGFHTSPTPSSVATASGAAAKTTTSTAASATTSAKRSATGQDVSFQYGDLELKVAVSGKRITDISVVQLNVSDPHSSSIDQSAIPQLTREAISAQSAKINAVSGASYTSQAYEQSLQSALDRLGITISAVCWPGS